MKRTLKLLAVVTVVGLLMLATTATTFAVPPFGGTPADQTPAGDGGVTPAGPNPAHDTSCDGQTGALENVNGNPQGAPAQGFVDDFAGALGTECE